MTHTDTHKAGAAISKKDGDKERWGTVASSPAGDNILLSGLPSKQTSRENLSSKGDRSNQGRDPFSAPSSAHHTTHGGWVLFAGSARSWLCTQAVCCAALSNGKDCSGGGCVWLEGASAPCVSHCRAMHQV